MPRGGPGKTRWIPVQCQEHNVPHGLTAGAAILAIQAGQLGDLVTTLGNPVCFLPLVNEHAHRTSGKVGDRTVDSIWSVE